MSASGPSGPLVFDWFFFIFADNEHKHEILDGFEIGQYLTKDL